MKETEREENLQSLLDFKTRGLLYLSSLSSLLFIQNYCTNVCPFIDGLTNAQIASNLFIVFVLHIVYREFLYKIYNTPPKNTSLPRHAYHLSILSWLIAGVTAFLIHFFKYPEFPVGSHLKLLSSYWVLGGGILAQIEYSLFEYRYKQTVSNTKYYVFNERISRRITESFVILSLAPSITITLILFRYYKDGVISEHVVSEIGYIVALFILFAILSAYAFGKMLKKDTKRIIDSISQIKNGSYDVSIGIKRADELGEISGAIESMADSIQQGIDEINTLNEEITSTQKEVVFTMGEIAESRSKETGNHVRRVAAYSELLALKYGLPEAEARLLRLASPMHDIGKVAIPDAILNKPGKHTQEEFEIMKTHAILGYGMLKHSNREILKTAAIVAYEHHEKYDGSGYPRGLRGENIHIYGRITAVADVFDALGSDRCYKKAWEDARIFALLKEERGKHFDPALIDIFFESLDEINAIRESYKD